jgi:two-component system, cell cycle sensor histidine kinase and response regulator CckA
MLNSRQQASGGPLTKTSLPRPVETVPAASTGLIVLFLLLLASISSCVDEGERRVVRVGIFQNEPIVFRDKNGLPKGLYVDLLNAIAKKEDWEIHYVFDSWDGCLTRLRTGDIDLMTSIAYTEKRDTYADFSRETVWTLWGMIFVHPKSGIEDVQSMDGKTVAVLKDGINGINFLKLAKEFGITCDVLYLPSYAAAFKAAESGKADAVVTNNVFGTTHGAKYRVNRSSIIFSPANAFFAVPEGRNKDLADTVDAYLRDWKKDDDSIYHRSLTRWLSPGTESSAQLPKWVAMALAGFVLASLILLLWTRLLRRQVDAKTAALRRAQEDLQASEVRFRTICENAPVLINAFDKDGRCVFWNKQCYKTFGCVTRQAMRSG